MKTTMARVAAGAIVAAVGATVAACGDEETTATSREIPATLPGCQTLTVPGEVPAQEPAGAKAIVPVPDGWTRDGSMEGEIVGVVLMAPKLQVNDFVPNAVITVEESPVTGPAEFARQTATLRQSSPGTELTVSQTGETCGQLSQQIEYQRKVPGGAVNTASVLIVTVPGSTGGTTFTLTVQTPDPENAEYLAAKQILFDELQVGTTAG